MYIDAHCHLEEETYGDQLPAVIDRAVAAGLTHLIAVGATRGILGAQEAVRLAAQHDNIFATAGIHPHDAAEANDETMAIVEHLLSHPKVVALGEVGLDFFYDHSPKDVQTTVFEAFLSMAKKHNLPVMLHIRDAHPEALSAIDKVGLPAAGGVVHCFTSGPKNAWAYVERGMYLSIPGVITFKNAADLREAVRQVPTEKLLLETDSPYLAPVPHRGRRNEPAYLVVTAAAVGALKGLSGAEMGALARTNTMRLFGLEKQ